MNKTMKTKTILNLAVIITALTIAIPYLTNAETVSGSSSSYTFYVDNCTNNKLATTLNCSPSTIKFQCDIQPTSFINNADFRIQGTEFSATQNSTNPTQFYYEYNKPQETNTNTDPITLDREQLTDVDGHKLNAFQTSTVNHNCTTCPTTITRYELTPCTITNTQTIGYISTNTTCTPNYNTTEACNYCNPDLQSNTTTCINGTQDISYNDNNYGSCCLVTGLPEDCPTNYYPYNTIVNQTCPMYASDLSCNVDTRPVIHDKINLVCTMPDSQDYCCVINLYQGNSLLSTSPEYKTTSNSFLTIASEQEARTCFQTTNLLMNGYYTDKELRPETPYKIQVLCSNNQTTKTSEYEIIGTYATPDYTTHMVKWAGDNATYLLLTTGLIIAGIILAIYIFKKI
jgi:hypothetical protein